MNKKAILGCLLLLTFGCTAPKGDVGPKGVTGATGDTGVAGQSGSTGVKGVTGDVGLQGATGVKGDVGVSGKLTSYSTGWKAVDWTLESSTNQRHVYSYTYIDDKITDQALNKSLNETYLSSVAKNVQVKFASTIAKGYRSIGSTFYSVSVEPSVGKLKFVMKNTQSATSTETAAAIRDSLNKDQAKFMFSAIY